MDLHIEKEHSDLIGGSIARRRLHCHGSYRLSKQIPAAVRNKSSPYADEGTACHYIIEQILNNDGVKADSFIGETIKLPNMTDAIVMTRQLVEETIIPCIDLFDELDDRYEDEGGLTYSVEVKCQFPGIEGAFGTCDVLARTARRTIIKDWKFGVGVAVKAMYSDTAITSGTVMVPGKRDINEQLLFYATAARHTRPEMFGEGDDWPVELFIAQPRSRDLEPGDDIYSHVTVTNSDLDRFAKRLQDALPKILANDAQVSPGDWCKFCPAVPVCPSKMNPSFAVTRLAEKFRPLTDKDKPVIPTPQELGGEAYAKLLDFSYVAEMVAHVVQEQAHTFIENGGKIPGYKTVPKRATERYIDEKGATRHVVGLGVDSEEIFTEPALKTPAQLSTVMEPLMVGKTKKDRLAAARQELEAFTEKVSSGTTLAHDADSRAAVTPLPTLMQDLAKRLKLAQAS